MTSMSIRRLSAAAFAAAAVLSVSACSVAVSKDGVQSKVMELLKPKNPQLQSVTCPEDLKGEVGATLKCTLAGADGQTGTATVKVTSVEDKTVNFEITDVA